MRITALVKSPEHVCCRYRIAAFRPFLEAAGHRLDLCPCPQGWFSGVRLPHNLPRSDAIIVQRKLLSASQLAQVRSLARWLIYDVDDAVFVRDSYAPRGLHSERRLRGFARMVRAADAVVVGNEFLRDHAALWADPARIHILRTSLMPERYPLAEHTRADNGVLLAWIGSASTLPGLARIAPLLDEIGRRLPGLALKLIGDRGLDLRNLPVQVRRWSEATECAELADADIGVSSLPDDLWSQGKCGLKVLQYMAAGLPVVANPVGVQQSLVRPGETGFLVSTPQEWVSTVERLARYPDLRRRMGAAGRRRVEAEYDVRHTAVQWLTLLAGLAHGASARAVTS
jgi:glycosyltransferase involved in cell wall biosynthesis